MSKTKLAGPKHWTWLFPYTKTDIYLSALPAKGRKEGSVGLPQRHCYGVRKVEFFHPQFRTICEKEVDHCNSWCIQQMLWENYTKDHSIFCRNSVSLDIEKLEMLPHHWNDLWHMAVAVKFQILYLTKPLESRSYIQHRTAEAGRHLWK